MTGRSRRLWRRGGVFDGSLIERKQAALGAAFVVSGRRFQCWGCNAGANAAAKTRADTEGSASSAFDWARVTHGIAMFGSLLSAMTHWLQREDFPIVSSFLNGASCLPLTCDQNDGEMRPEIGVGAENERLVAA